MAKQTALEAGTITWREADTAIRWIANDKIKAAANGTFVEAVAHSDNGRELAAHRPCDGQENSVKSDLGQPSSERVNFETTYAVSDILDQDAGAAFRQFVEDTAGNRCKKRTAATGRVKHPTSGPINTGKRGLFNQPDGEARRRIVNPQGGAV